MFDWRRQELIDFTASKYPALAVRSRICLGLVSCGDNARRTVRAEKMTWAREHIAAMGVDVKRVEIDSYNADAEGNSPLVVKFKDKTLLDALKQRVKELHGTTTHV